MSEQLMVFRGDFGEEEEGERDYGAIKNAVYARNKAGNSIVKLLNICKNRKEGDLT